VGGRETDDKIVEFDEKGVERGAGRKTAQDALLASNTLQQSFEIEGHPDVGEKTVLRVFVGRQLDPEGPLPIHVALDAHKAAERPEALVLGRQQRKDVHRRSLGRHDLSSTKERKNGMERVDWND